MQNRSKMLAMLRSGIICAVAVMLCCGSASAGPAEALEEAKRFAKQANTHYALARFQEASDAYTHSYELVPLPGLLFNLGQCQLALKNFDRAIFFFEGYLRDKPDAPNAALVRDLMAEAHKEQAAQQAKEAAAETMRLAALSRAQPAPPPPPPPPRDKRRIPAVSLGAGSMALLGASLYLGLRSDMANDGARLSATGSDERAAFNRDRRNFAIAAGVTGGVALGAAVASGVLGYLGWRQPRHATVSASPTATGGTATVSGSF